MVNYYKLDNLLHDINFYNCVIYSHSKQDYKNMLPTYRLMRQEIKDKYNLHKGEFTTYYAISRGRKNVI